MTVFVAVKPVSLTGAGIASAFDIFDTGYTSTRSPAEYKATANAGDVRLDFKSVSGSPFTYAFSPPPGPPSGGKIASLEIDTTNALTLAYKFSNMSLSVATLAQHVAQNNANAVANDFLGGNDTITGSQGADFLNGFAGNDRITGRGGDDTMRGGPGVGNDTFVFRAGFGHDKIADFTVGATAAQAHDKIELHSIPGLANFAQVHAHAALVSGHVVITATSGDSITLLNVHAVDGPSGIHAYDFAFLA